MYLLTQELPISTVSAKEILAKCEQVTLKSHTYCIQSLLDWSVAELAQTMNPTGEDLFIGWAKAG